MTNGRLLCVDLDAVGRHDAHQSVVHRPRQLAPVHDELAAELQHMRRGLRCMLLIALAALLEDIEEEDRRAGTHRPNRTTRLRPD